MLQENTYKQLNEIRKMMHEQNENTNKEIETILKNPTEILELNTIIELKISLETFNNRLNQAEERISELEHKSFEITELEE